MKITYIIRYKQRLHKNLISGTVFFPLLVIFYISLQITSPSNWKKFSQVLLITDDRIDYSVDLIGLEGLCSFRVVYEQDLRLDNIVSKVRKIDIKPTTDTLLICGIGIDDFIDGKTGDSSQDICQRMENHAFTMLGTMKKAKLVKKKLKSLCSKNSEVFFTYVLSVDIARAFYKSELSESEWKHVKAMNQQLNDRILYFNRYVDLVLPSALKKDLIDYFPLVDQKAANFVVDNTDGWTLNKSSADELSKSFGTNLKDYCYSLKRFEHIIIVGDSHFDNIVRAWPADRFSSTILIDSFYKLSNIVSGDPIVEELSIYKNALIILNLGFHDLHIRQSFTCPCGENLEIFAAKTLSMEKDELLAQVLSSMETAEQVLKQSLVNCTVIFAMCDIPHAAQYQVNVLEDHYYKTNCLLKMRSSFIPMGTMMKGINRLKFIAFIYNEIVSSHCTVNNLPVLNRLPSLWKLNDDPVTNPVTCSIKCFSDGIKLTPAAAQEVAKYFYDMVDALSELMPGSALKKNTSVSECLQARPVISQKAGQNSTEVDESNKGNPVSMGKGSKDIAKKKDEKLDNKIGKCAAVPINRTPTASGPTVNKTEISPHPGNQAGFTPFPGQPPPSRNPFLGPQPPQFAGPLGPQPPLGHPQPPLGHPVMGPQPPLGHPVMGPQPPLGHPVMGLQPPLGHPVMGPQPPLGHTGLAPQPPLGHTGLGPQPPYASPYVYASGEPFPRAPSYDVGYPKNTQVQSQQPSWNCQENPNPPHYGGYPTYEQQNLNQQESIPQSSNAHLER